VTKYNDLQLSGGEYLNLYDLAWDKPEGHVVRKDEKLYYGFFAPHWSRGSVITLRGLDAEREYVIRDYANDVDLGLIHGNNPVLKMAFKESLLLEVTPIKK